MESQMAKLYVAMKVETRAKGKEHRVRADYKTSGIKVGDVHNTSRGPWESPSKAKSRLKRLATFLIDLDK